MAMRVVIDTNVLFEGLTKQKGVCYYIIQAWDQQRFDVMVSYPLLLEYQDVLGRKLSETKFDRITPILDRLIAKTHKTHVYYRWRPMSPDPGDDLVIECTMNSNALLVTYNIKDFRLAQQTVGLRVNTPIQFAKRLTGQKQ